MDDLPVWVKLSLAFLFAAFSGFVAFLQQFAVKKLDRPKWDWLEGFVKSMTAGLAGFFTALAVQKAGLDFYTAAFLVGVAGWGGAETFVFFKEVFQDGIRRAARNVEQSETDEDSSAAR